MYVCMHVCMCMGIQETHAQHVLFVKPSVLDTMVFNGLVFNGCVFIRVLHLFDMSFVYVVFGLCVEGRSSSGPLGHKVCRGF